MAGKDKTNTAHRTVARGGMGSFARPAALATAASLSVALALAATPSASASKGTKRTSACPKQARAALPLPGNAVAKAAEVALAEAPRRFKAINTHGAKILRAELGEMDGKYLAHQCGERVQKRTVVVELRFPKMLPSASLSAGTVFVSRFKSGYRVWEVSPIG
jgi:hypothetical protein